MRIPSRVYVGVVVFGLIASLSTLAYAILVVSGYEPAAGSPHELLFPEPEDDVPGQALFLVLAAAFSIAFTVLAVRALLQGAREEAAFQRLKPALEAELKRRRKDGDTDEDREPPGYS